MSLSSMTGFARRDGVVGAARWAWEVRSVNGRGLDVRLRLPPGWDALDPPSRAAIAKALGRGSVTANLQLETDVGPGGIRLNEAALAAAIAAAAEIHRRVGGPPATADAIIGVRGVLEPADQAMDDAARETLSRAVIGGLEAALRALVEARRDEGRAIAAVVAAQIDTIAALVTRAEASDGRKPEAIRARLAEQIRRLLDVNAAFDAERLHQEAVLIATRVDVQEELDRLKAHVEQARVLIAGDGAVGRRLDFLAQEFGREANTLCSKANDSELSRIGLEMKATVDQLREQVQNLE